jgi:phage/plasmid-associated DNA primase
VPDTKDDTDAFFDRWVIIEFKARFRGTNQEIPKPQLLAKLCTPEELSGLAMEGLKRLPALLETGHFNRTTNVENLRAKYIRNSDPIGAFSMECIVEDENAETSKDDVFRAYVRYCLDRQLVRRDKDVFCKILETKRELTSIQKTIEGVRVRCWRGIRVTVSGEDNETNNTPCTPFNGEDKQKTLTSGGFE